MPQTQSSPQPSSSSYHQISCAIYFYIVLPSRPATTVKLEEKIYFRSKDALWLGNINCSYSLICFILLVIIECCENPFKTARRRLLSFFGDSFLLSVRQFVCAKNPSHFRLSFCHWIASDEAFYSTILFAIRRSRSSKNRSWKLRIFIAAVPLTNMQTSEICIPRQQ